MIAYNVRQKGTGDWFAIEAANEAVAALIMIIEEYKLQNEAQKVYIVETEDPEGLLQDVAVTFNDITSFAAHKVEDL